MSDPGSATLPEPLTHNWRESSAHHICFTCLPRLPPQPYPTSPVKKSLTISNVLPIMNLDTSVFAF